EDGIRDGHVTGVQTCALPICRSEESAEERRGHEAPEIARTALEHEGAGVIERHLGFEFIPAGDVQRNVRQSLRDRGKGQQVEDRSEERRVGKEGSWGWGWIDI